MPTRWPVALRWLGRFWLSLLVLGGAGAATLQVMGPPRRQAAVVAASPPSPEPVASRAWDGRIVLPDAALLETSQRFPGSFLPRVGADGRMPRLVYRRPSAPPGKGPRIALILAGVGLSASESRAAIEALPGAVTLAFSAYAANSASLVEMARSRGHEMLASLPMEPQGYPLNDAGPRALLTGSTPATNQENLEWVLSRMQGYAGVTGASDGMLGERFAAQTSSFGLVTDELARRGLMYVDSRPGAPPPAIAGRSVSLVVEPTSGRADVEAKLAALERMAREQGSAIGLAGPIRPVTVERIAAWARDLEARGFELVPVSALIAETRR